MIGDHNNISEQVKNNLETEEIEEDLDSTELIKDINDNEKIEESSYETNQLHLESSIIGTNQLLLNESIEKDHDYELYDNDVINNHVIGNTTNDDDNNNINENIDINQQNNHKKVKLNIKNIKKPVTKWILFSNEYRSTLIKEMANYNNTNNTSMKGMSIGD